MRSSRSRPAPDGAAGGFAAYVALLRECRGYRLLFYARSISLLGDWFSLIAVVALFREVAGSNAQALSGLLILKLLPIFLAGPVAGVVADRFSRKAIMIVSDVVRLVLVLGLLAAPFTPDPIRVALVLIFLQVTASAFSEPARSASLPQLVPWQRLSTANALGAVTWSLAFALGSALGGVVTDLAGWRTALVLDAGSYAISALLVRQIRLPRRVRRASGPVDWRTLSGIRDVEEGIRFVVGRPPVATALLIKAGWGVAGAITLFVTLFGERVYAVAGRPDLGVSLLYFARAVGTGIGPLLARRLLPDESPRSMRWLISGSFLWAVCWYVVFARVEHAATAALAVALAHFGGSALWVYSSVLLQRLTPDEFRGRVMAADLGLATLTISVSTFGYGLLIDLPGASLRALMAWMAASLLLPAAGFFWATLRWPLGVQPTKHDPSR